MSVATPTAPEPLLDVSDDGVGVQWPDGHQSFFHYVWLRDCCYCEECGDSYSSNRFLRPDLVPLDIEALSVDVIDGAELHITWKAPHEHISCYQLTWLRSNCYSDAARAERRHRPALWDARIVDTLPAVDYTAAAESDAGCMQLLRKLRDFGFVVVRNGPCTDDGIERVASLIGDIAESAYGRLFDLSPKSSIKTLGNTLHPVAPHTDEAYRYAPPGVNVLHCVRPADEGGESILVDGFHLGALLRARAPQAFRLLASQPQPFHRIGTEDGIDQRSRASVFTLDENDAIVGFRFHTRSAAPLDVSADLLPAIYAANHTLATFMMDADNQARFRLEAGDAVMFDNHRVMHSRAGFADPERKLRICNVSREQFHERLRLTARRLRLMDEANQVLATGVCG